MEDWRSNVQLLPGLYGANAGPDMAIAIAVVARAAVTHDKGASPLAPS